MKRLLLIALVPLALSGCRSSCNRSSMMNSPCKSQATPVSFGGGPVMTGPASYSSPMPNPAGSYPMVPSPGNAATELPFPAEAIPAPGLPTSGMPNNTRAVGLPK